jgi:DNA-binding CsgD family transcriptional regulator
MGTTQWPLRARARELETALTAVLDEPGAAILVGAAGVGKTRIVREAAERLAAMGHQVEWVAATRASMAVPFGAFARFLDQGSVGASDRFWLLHEIRNRLLQGRAGDQPVILAVDDAHWLDDGSAALVYQLAMVSTVRLMLSVRSGEGRSDAVERLWRDGHALRIDIEPFDLEATTEVVSAALEGPVDRLTTGRLRRLTGGNALFLREVMEATLQDGSIRCVDGVWRWSGPAPLTTRLRDLLRERFEACAAKELEALRLVALGEPLEADALSGIIGLQLVEALCERGLLKTDSSGRTVQLAHPLYGESLLALTPPITARRLRRVLADALARLPSDPDRLLRRVSLLQDAGETVPETELRSAVERALTLYDGRLAERLARALDPAEPAHAMALARALSQQDRPAEAEQALAGVDTDRLDPGTLVIYIGARSQNFAYGLLRTDLAMKLLDEFAPRVPEAVAPVLVCLRVIMLMLAGRHREAVALAEANPWLQDLDLDSPFFLTVPALALALDHIGRPGSALRLLEARNLSSLHPEHQQEFAAIEAYTLFLMGRLDAQDAMATRMRGWGAELMWPLAAAMGASHHGMAEFARGRMGRAVEAFREAVSIAREHNPYGVLRWALPWLAATEAASGQRQAAEEALAEWAELSKRWETVRYLGELDELQEAFTLACIGRISEARTNLVAMAERYAQASLSGHAVEALHLLARLGGAAQAAASLEGMTAAWETPVPTVHAAHIRALAARRPSDLLEIAEEYEALDMYHLAAEAADAAAAEQATSGESRKAAAARHYRDLLLSNCDTGPLPWWPTTRPERLTARESEIAGMAASGMTSTEIAARLRISSRTVENHLQRAYIKLGVSSRSELAARFSSLSLDRA